MAEMIASWDAQTLLFIQEHIRTAIGNFWIPIYSKLGNIGLIWIALSLLLLCFPKTRRAGGLALGAMLLNLLVVNGIIKHLVARPRPWLVVDGLHTLLFSDDPNSFPSGHTSAAFAFAMAMCGRLPVKWGKILAVIAALLMGWSRIYVAVHFPSDVIAGAVIGALCGLVLVWIDRRFLEKKFPSH